MSGIVLFGFVKNRQRAMDRLKGGWWQENFGDFEGNVRRNVFFLLTCMPQMITKLYIYDSRRIHGA